MTHKCILKTEKVEVRGGSRVRQFIPCKNGSLSEFLLTSIHFSQSNGLWRSDWFYTELNVLQCVYVNTIKSPPNVYMIQSFSQWTTTELDFPKVAVHFLSACDEWLRLPRNSDPLSHSLNSHIAFSAKQVAAHFSKNK